MMTYQKILNNLPPKENDKGPNISKEHSDHINVEKEQLARSVTELRSNLGYAEQELLSKEHEIMQLNNKLLHMEARLQRYEYLTGELDQVENLDDRIKSLNTEMEGLKKENDDLTKSVTQYKSHVQTLYLILVVSVIM